MIQIWANHPLCLLESKKIVWPSTTTQMSHNSQYISCSGKFSPTILTLMIHCACCEHMDINTNIHHYQSWAVNRFVNIYTCVAIVVTTRKSQQCTQQPTNNNLFTNENTNENLTLYAGICIWHLVFNCDDKNTTIWWNTHKITIPSVNLYFMMIITYHTIEIMAETNILIIFDWVPTVSV